jgi:hypothetical protein
MHNNCSYMSGTNTTLNKCVSHIVALSCYGGESLLSALFSTYHGYLDYMTRRCWRLHTILPNSFIFSLIHTDILVKK